MTQAMVAVTQGELTRISAQLIAVTARIQQAAIVLNDRAKLAGI